MEINVLTAYLRAQHALVINSVYPVSKDISSTKAKRVYSVLYPSARSVYQLVSANNAKKDLS